MNKKLILLFFVLNYFNGLAQTSETLTSPDGKTEITINFGNKLNRLISYDLAHQQQFLLKQSSIGIQLKGETDQAEWQKVSTKRKSSNKIWKNICGERDLVTDQYNAISIVFASSLNKQIKCTVNFRVYNEGIAYQYDYADKDATLTLTAEKSAFNFAKNDTAWVTKTAQGLFTKTPISEIKEAAERPMTIKHASNLYYAIGEAGLVDYARMKLINYGGLTLSSVLSGDVIQKGKLLSPWRYVLIGNSAGDLLAKNYLLLNLNEPNQIKNTKWIKPGKVIRENSLTTDGSYETIDFAAKHHIPYVSFDAGWYGKEDADTSDASRVMVDPARSKGPLDLQKVIAYGKTKDVGIILYVNRRALERQLDQLLPIYKQWGIKGIKFGFVRVGDQKWTSWLHEAIRKCAKYEMVVDVHDEYRPTGYSRTYPNLLTQEGIRGDEESPTSDIILTTVFTRMIAGAGDQTNAYFTKRVEKMGSHTSQMAKTICIFSPLQFIYWYDRPAGKRNNPANEGVINEVPELEFYDNLPTTWSDTKILEGDIGNYATIARKKDNDWYLGSLTENERIVNMKFDFLTSGKTYTAYIYSDNANSTTLTKVAIDKKTLTNSSNLTFTIRKNNGLAMRIVQNN